MTSSTFAETWLKENYDIHLTCQIVQACTDNKCKNINNGWTQTLHFSLGADLYNWTKYRTCNYNYSMDIKERLTRECTSEWHSDRSYGLWTCSEEGLCSKNIVKSYGPNIVYAMQHRDAFNLATSEYNGTQEVTFTKDKLAPGSGVIEYFIDNTRGTLIMRHVDRCLNYDVGECEGAYLTDGRNFIKHREAYTQNFNCKPIKGKLF